MRIREKFSLIFGIPAPSFLNRFRSKKVFVSELRPGLEGASLVAHGLLKKGIQPVIICDNMMAFCMERGMVKGLHIFYHAINRRYVLCRTGSLVAALCAKFHRIPVYLSRAGRFDQKDTSLLEMAGRKVISSNIKIYVPLFEEVPLALITDIENA